MYLSIATSLFGVVSTIRRGREARQRRRHARSWSTSAVSAAGIVTGVALLVRELRRLDIDDVLADD